MNSASGNSSKYICTTNQEQLYMYFHSARKPLNKAELCAKANNPFSVQYNETLIIQTP